MLIVANCGVNVQCHKTTYLKQYTPDFVISFSKIQHVMTLSAGETTKNNRTMPQPLFSTPGYEIILGTIILVGPSLPPVYVGRLSPAHLKHLDEVAFDLACISCVCIPPPHPSCCSDFRDAQMTTGYG